MLKKFYIRKKVRDADKLIKKINNLKQFLC